MFNPGWFHSGKTGRKLAGRLRPALFIEPLETRTVPSFLPPIRFPVGLRPGPIVAADLSSDGVPDLLVVNQGQFPTRESSLSVLLGAGDGTFQNAVTTDVLADTTSLAVGDVNGDGLPDVALTSGVNNVVQVLFGVGDGTFENGARIFHVGRNPRAAALADLDGNGTLDVVTVNFGSNSASVLLGNGDGSFEPRVEYAVGSRPPALVLHDFNGDGVLDLVTANPPDAAVSVLLGVGDGTFQMAQEFPAGDYGMSPTSLAVGDVNGDGLSDLVITEAFGFETFVGVLLSNGDGTFQAPLLTDAGFGLISLAVDDFNGDSLLDVVLAASQDVPGRLFVFLGNGDGSFQTGSAFPTGGNNPFAVTAGDLNGDSLPDLIAANTFSNTVGVLLNTGSGSAPSAGELPAWLVAVLSPSQTVFAVTAPASPQTIDLKEPFMAPRATDSTHLFRMASIRNQSAAAWTGEEFFVENDTQDLFSGESSKRASSSAGPS